MHGGLLCDSLMRPILLKCRREAFRVTCSFSWLYLGRHPSVGHSQLHSNFIGRLPHRASRHRITLRASLLVRGLYRALRVALYLQLCHLGLLRGTYLPFVFFEPTVLCVGLLCRSCQQIKVSYVRRSRRVMQAPRCRCLLSASLAVILLEYHWALLSDAILCWLMHLGKCFWTYCHSVPIPLSCFFCRFLTW